MIITMADIDERLKIVEDNTTKILFYLENDDKTGKKGIVAQVENNTERVSLLELQKKMERARNGIFGAMGGVAVAIVYIVITAFVNQKIK
jgi:hypothetical protein